MDGHTYKHIEQQTREIESLITTLFYVVTIVDTIPPSHIYLFVHSFQVTLFHALIYIFIPHHQMFRAVPYTIVTMVYWDYVPTRIYRILPVVLKSRP
jgi:hypothetical protein